MLSLQMSAVLVRPGDYWNGRVVCAVKRSAPDYVRITTTAARGGDPTTVERRDDDRLTVIRLHNAKVA